MVQHNAYDMKTASRQPTPSLRPHSARDHAKTAAKAFAIKPARWQRWAVHGSILALLLTGLVWLLAHYFLRTASEFGGELPHPLEGWALRLHGIFAYAFVFVFGSMSTVHIILAWTRHRNRRSGALLLSSVVLLAISALGLYYGADTVHSAVSVIHWVIGLTLLPVLWLHIYFARHS